MHCSTKKIFSVLQICDFSSCSYAINKCLGIEIRKLKFHTSSLRFKAKIIDGKQIANDILIELKQETEQWIAQGNRRPQLTAILVGEDPASKTYVRNKMKAAKQVGINTKTINCSASITEKDLLQHIHLLNNDPEVDGILVQLPIPNHITERAICNAVAPSKDVDGFNIVNVGRFCLDMKTLVPCTPLGVQELIKRSGEHFPTA